MFEKIRKLKDRKGFTLVELIVVLVILAILAALLIPALTGYIDKANKEKVIAECRMAVMAVQTESTTIYGAKGKVTAPDDFTEKVTVDGNDTTRAAVVRSLAEVSGQILRLPEPFPRRFSHAVKTRDRIIPAVRREQTLHRILPSPHRPPPL